MTTNKKAAPGANRAASIAAFSARHSTATALDNANRTPPIVNGQCAEVLHLLRALQPVPSFTLTADHAIPEAAARVHDLRAKGFNVLTDILPVFEFRGLIRRNVALYSLGVPEWPRPDFLEDEEDGDD